MNEAQRQWTSKKKDELEAYCSKHYPLSDQEANEVVEWIDKTVSMAKGKTSDCRDEVRHALFDVLDAWERKSHGKKI